MADTESRLRDVYDSLRNWASKGKRKLVSSLTGWNEDSDEPPQVAFEAETGGTLIITLDIEEERWLLEGPEFDQLYVGILRVSETYQMSHPALGRQPKPDELPGYVAGESKPAETDSASQVALWIRNRAEETHHIRNRTGSS